MSASSVNELMEIWDTYMEPHDAYSPYTGTRELLATIDSSRLGDAPWYQLNITYDGDAGPFSPSWMSASYEVWFRDPVVVARNMLNNPDFRDEFDYAPYIELGRDGQRRWTDFMSGNFAWRHAVSNTIIFSSSYCFRVSTSHANTHHTGRNLL